MLREAFDLVLAGVFGAIPFLPRGKGALILIFGGMAVLTFSLLWSSVLHRRSAAIEPDVQDTTSTRPTRGSLSIRLAETPPPPLGVPPDTRVAWLRTVMATAARAGLGQAELVQSESLRHVVLLTNCRACRGRRRGSGCEHERRLLEQIMRTFAPQGRVVELTCNAGRRGACTFELRSGAPAK